MSKELPNNNEIESTARVLKAREFLYLAAFADIINRYVDIMFRKDKISRLRNGVLQLLIARGGSLTPTRLGRLMFRSKNSMTKVIDNLEKDGLVIRERVDKDRRVVNVKITSDGLNFVIQSLSAGDELTGEVMSSLDENERKVMIDMVQRMRRTMVRIIRSQ